MRLLDQKKTWKGALDFPAGSPIYVRAEPKLCETDICELLPVRARFQTAHGTVIRTVFLCPECGTYSISRGYYENLTEGMEGYTFIPMSETPDPTEDSLRPRRTSPQTMAGWAITHPCQGGVCRGK